MIVVLSIFLREVGSPVQASCRTMRRLVLSSGQNLALNQHSLPALRRATELILPFRTIAWTGCSMNKVALLASRPHLSLDRNTRGGIVGGGVCGRAAPAEGSQLPSTAAVVRLVKDWVTTINSADDAAYLRFVESAGLCWAMAWSRCCSAISCAAWNCAGSSPPRPTP